MQNISNIFCSFAANKTKAMSEMTDYQKAVAKHMATAPQELAEYVRGRLVSSITWREDQSPINLCEFSWVSSEEGDEFWVLVDIKNWPKAMATDFWRSRTASSEASSERPKGGEKFGEMFEAAVQFEKPEHPEEYDFVNPKHYQEFSVEVIDMMASIWGKEATALHCEMCAFKYRLRIGSKPNQSIEDELGKINWYMKKAKELRS